MNMLHSVLQKCIPVDAKCKYMKCNINVTVKSIVFLSHNNSNGLLPTTMIQENLCVFKPKNIHKYKYTII